MTTLIISSIIALLVIAGAGIGIGKWIDWQSRSKRFRPFKYSEADHIHTFSLSERQLQEINAQLKPRVYWNGQFIGFLESDEEIGQKLVDEAKEILKHKP